MLVGSIAPPRPLDVSSIDRASIVKLATLPRDEEIGTLADVEEADEALLLPIVMPVSDTGEQAARFTDVASVEPALWNACVEVPVLHMQDQLTESESSDAVVRSVGTRSRASCGTGSCCAASTKHSRSTLTTRTPDGVRGGAAPPS
jgi:hypothetical protein